MQHFQKKENIFFDVYTSVEQVTEMQDHLLNNTLAIAYGVWARGQFLNHYDQFTDVLRLRYGFPAQPSIFPFFETTKSLNTIYSKALSKRLFLVKTVIFCRDVLILHVSGLNDYR